VDVAIDFVCEDHRQAELATAFLTRTAVQKWRRRGDRSHIEINTRYWKPAKVPRNIALYGHRQSKVNKRPCAHFELRFKGARACRQAGLSDLNLLARGLHAMPLLVRQAKIMLMDPVRLDRGIERQARRALPKTQLQMPNITVGAIKEQI